MNTSPSSSRPLLEQLRPHRRHWPWIASALVLAVAGGAWWGLSGKDSGAAEGAAGKKGFGNRVTPVLAATVRKGDMPVILAGLGTVTPLSNVTVKSRVDGQLMEVRFQEGQGVRKGQVLAVIDERPFKVQLDQALGQLSKDQALLDNARLDLARYRSLIAQDSIAKQQVDAQEALVRQYEGSLKTDKAAVDNARLQLEYARISAPAAGRAGLRQVDPGNLVKANDSNGLVTITQTRPISVLFALPEDHLPALQKRLRSGEKLSVEAWDREQRQKLTSGSLASLDNQVDTATGTVKLKARFVNDDEALFPNQFVNIRLALDTRKDALLVPSSAIQRGKQNEAFVYVIKDDKSVTVRNVKTGPAAGETIVVEEGLALGEQVVADGADKLREGAKVEPAAPGAGKGGPGGERRKGGMSGKPGEGKPEGAPGKPAEGAARPAEGAGMDGAKKPEGSAAPKPAGAAQAARPAEAGPTERKWDPEKAAEWKKRRGGE